jgi:hypothetical protein
MTDAMKGSNQQSAFGIRELSLAGPEAAKMVWAPLTQPQAVFGIAFLQERSPRLLAERKPRQ